MLQERQAHDFVAVSELDAAHASRLAALEHAHLANGEADAFATAGGKQDVVALAADLNADNAVARIELHRNLAVAVNVREIRKLVSSNAAGFGSEDHVHLLPLGFVFWERENRRDALSFRERQQIHHRLAATLDARLR